MWWGGGGKDQDPVEEGASPTTPINIQGRARGHSDDDSSSPPSSPLSSSFGSSYGSPGSDLAEIRDLKKNFSNQEQLLGQLRDVLQSNSKMVVSKEKEDYASRLAVMRSNRKSSSSTKSVLETSTSTADSGTKVQGERMQMLRKQLDETKARQEAELRSRRELESIVTGLQKELEERDAMIASMHLSSVTSSAIGSPFVMSPDHGSPDDSPGSTTPPTGYSGPYGEDGGASSIYEQLSAKDNKIIEQQEEIVDLKRQVWDLEEGLKEKDEIISARTAAVGLASASLAAKGRDTLEQLEDTRSELRSLQEKWSKEQMEWKREKEESKIVLEAAQTKVDSLQESNKRLEQGKEELVQKNLDYRQQISSLEEEVAMVKSRAREEKILLEAKVEEIEEQKLAAENRVVKNEEIYKEKIDNIKTHSKKGSKKKSVDDRISSLEISLAEIEEEKGALQLKLVELEDVAASEQKLRSRVMSAEESSRRLTDELETQERKVNMIEAEKVDIMEALATRDTEIESMQQEINKVTSSKDEISREKLELEIKCVQLEEERDRLEGDKLEIVQKQHQLEAEYKEKLLPFEQLRNDYDELVAKHEQFSTEHASAMERSRLYDTDMLEKARKIKEQSIELKTLENLLHEKTKEMSDQLSDLDIKQRELVKAKETITNFEDVIGSKQTEIESLKSVIAESSEHCTMVTLRSTCSQLQKDLNLVLEAKTSLESELKEKNLNFDALMQNYSLKCNELESVTQDLEQSQLFNSEISQKIAELQNTIESKTLEVDEEKRRSLVLSNNLGELQEKMSKEETVNAENLEKLNQLKDDFDGKSKELAEAVSNIAQLNSEKDSKDKEICQLKDDLSVKDGDIAAVNEEITSKYSIIENLQSEIDVRDRKITELESEKLSLESDNSSLSEEIASKCKSLEMLQTTIEVLESSQFAAGDLNKQLAALQQSILDKDNEIITLQDGLHIMENDKTELAQQQKGYEAKIESLKKEIVSFEDVSSQLADCRMQLLKKDEEISSLQEKLEIKLQQISNLESVESSSPNQFVIEQQTEQIQILQVQLKEKCELLQSAQDKIAFKDESSNDDGNEDSKEIDNLRKTVEDLKAQKVLLENKNVEIEQFREEVAKESNQHMAEASEKIKELKSQLESKQEEVQGLVVERDNLGDCLTKAQDELRAFEAKYHDALNTVSEADLIRERDQLKEKNEKLTGMCKKYIAKIKQLDAQIKQNDAQVENAQKEEFTLKITSLESELEEVKSGNSILQDEIISKYQLIEMLQNQAEEAQQQLEKVSSDLENLQASSNLKNLENEEIIRNLKQKLEDTPENVSVPVDLAAATSEHEKTKTELNNLKEKCKKLIVKVKQQDAVIKRAAGGRKESTSSEVSVSEDQNQQTAEEVEKLKRLNREINLANETLKYELTEIKTLYENIEASKNELLNVNETLQQKLNDEEEKHGKTKNKLKSKSEELQKQINQLVSEQIEIKNEAKDLRVINQQLKTKHEDALTEVRKIRESNLVSQMLASPLLAEATEDAQKDQGFSGFGEDKEDQEDGWGSQELEPEKSKLEEESVEPEPESDGWGGWDNGAEEIKLDDDGLKNIENEADADNVKNLVEREADIEDGWGDDSWGGFGDGEENPTGVASGLAENLRMVENEEDGLESHQVNSAIDLDKTVAQLESKILEKDSVIESLENELKVLRSKYEATNEELRVIEEEKEELDQKLEKQGEELNRNGTEIDKFLSVVENLSTEVENLKEIESKYSHLVEEKMLLEDKHLQLKNTVEELENKISDLEGNAKLSTEDVNFIDEKYKESLRTIEELERQQIQSNMDAESKEIALKEEIQQNETRIASLEFEISSLNEQIEVSENNLSDMRESVVKLTERRNSLDGTVTNLTSAIDQYKQEIEEYVSKIANFEAQGDISSLLESKQLQIDDLNQKVSFKSDQLEQLTISRDNLLAENETLRNNLSDVENEKKSVTESCETEMNNLRSMVMDLTGENESLQDRISSLEAVRERGQHPPPDITHNPPDVAVSTNNNPDIMSSAAAPGVNPDIMDLGVQGGAGGGWGWGEGGGGEAANWFDQVSEQVEPQPPADHLQNRIAEQSAIIEQQQHLISQQEAQINDLQMNLRSQSEAMAETVQLRMAEQTLTIEQQQDLIRQHETQIQDLSNNLRSQTEIIERQNENIDQFKKSDETNLKAIETLEANIWEATDSKNQLFAENGLYQSEIQNLVTKLKDQCEENEKIKIQVESLQQELLMKSSEVEMRPPAEAMTSPVPIVSSSSQDQPQSPTPAVFSWSNVSSNDDNVPVAVNMFSSAPVQSSAASFFEDLGASSNLPSANNFFEGTDQTSSSNFFNPPTTEPSVSNPISSFDEGSQLREQQKVVTGNQHDEILNLKQDLQQKIDDFDQVSQQLKTVKAQLELKEKEADSLQSASNDAVKNLETQLHQNSGLLQQLEDLNNCKEDLNKKLSQQMEQNSGLLKKVDSLNAALVELQSKSTDDTGPRLDVGEASVNQEASQPAVSSLASSFFGQDQSSTASYFGQTVEDDKVETSPDPSSYFNSPQQESAQQTGNTDASSYFSSPQPETYQQQEQQDPSGQHQELPKVEDLSPDQMTANLSWYQSELAQYQQACADWQVWGEEKTREISELQEHLSYQTEAFRIKAAENEKLSQKFKENEESDKNTDAQNMVKLKELEVADLKESVDRLESEKDELSEEINEMRNTVAELRSINENVEAYRDDSAQLLDTKMKLEEAEKDKAKIFAELSDMRNEMATVQFSNDKTIKDLRKDLDEKGAEKEDLQLKFRQSENKILDLENSLAEEKKMQEEIADEYESMQLQVQESNGRISELLQEIDELKGKVQSAPTEATGIDDLNQKIELLTAELEQYKQTCNDWNVYNETKTGEFTQLYESYNQYVEAYNKLQTEFEAVSSKNDTIGSEDQYTELVAQVETLKEELSAKEKDLETFAQMQTKYQEAKDEVESLTQKLSEASVAATESKAKLTSESVSNINIDSEASSNLVNLTSESVSNISIDAESTNSPDITNSATQDENLAAKEKELEVKVAEYNALLEAYNQYVAAYDYLNLEFGKLQQQSVSGSPEAEQLKQTIAAKDQEIETLKQQVEAKETELVDKTCAVAKMSISSALSASMKKKVEVPEPSHSKEDSWSEDHEGWGVEHAEVQQSASSQDVILLETEISELRGKMRGVEEERNKVSEELNAAKLKNGKLLVKVKQLQKEVETLKKSKGTSPDMDDLDKALQDEMKLQADKAHNELHEVKKEMQSIKAEKENLSKKVETLLTANETMISMKEKQDNEVEFLQMKNKELANKVEALNWQMSEVEERRETEVKDLSSQLQVLTSQSGDETDSTQLKLELAALKTQLEESNQECDRLRSDVAALSQSLIMAQTETATVKSQVIDLQDAIDRLNHEKDELEMFKSSSVSGGDAYEEILQLNNSLNAEISSLKQFIQSQNMYGGSTSTTPSDQSPELDLLREQVRKEQQLVLHLEQDLQAKEESLKSLEEELFLVRDLKLKKEEELQSGLDSSRESCDREVFHMFSDKELIMENQRLKADLDNVSRQRRHLSERISKWEHELNRDDISSLGEDGLRQELRIAIKTLQIRDHKCEEVTQENLRLIEERDMLMLKLSTTMRQLEGSRAASMAGSRTTTPVPSSTPGPSQMGIGLHFDPSAEIRGLHSKLEELRKLNYSLDVELQKERTDRMRLEEKVMSPRSAQASKMLPTTDREESPSKKVHHF